MNDKSHEWGIGICEDEKPLLPVEVFIYGAITDHSLRRRLGDVEAIF